MVTESALERTTVLAIVPVIVLGFIKGWEDGARRLYLPKQHFLRMQWLSISAKGAAKGRLAKTG